MTEYERLTEVCHHLRLSFPKFAAAIGHKSPQTFYEIKSGKNKLSRDLAKRITTTFPEISIEWLLTGEGEMLKGIGATVTQQNEQGDNLNDSIKIVGGSPEWFDIINKRDEQIDRLLAIIERMQGEK